MESSSPTESVREFLLQKRSSLTYTPDVKMIPGHKLHCQVRVLQKLEQQAGAGGVHEFQKVNGESGQSKRMLSCGYHELVGFEKLSESS